MKVVKFIFKIIRCIATAIWWVMVIALAPLAVVAFVFTIKLASTGEILGIITLIPYLFIFIISLLRYK